MINKNKTNIIGITFFLITSLLLFIIMPYILTSLDVNTGGKIKYLGYCFTVFGWVYFLYERYNGLEFFYGKSQSAGSNANSYFILAIGLQFFNLDIYKFLAVVVIYCIVMLLIGNILIKKNKLKKQ